MAQKGRPRDVKLQHVILTVAYELLLEGGFEEVTIDKIAEKAGVSKATIYKWWPNKAAVVAEGFFEAAASRLPVPDTGSVLKDVMQHAVNLSLFMESKEGRVISELIGQGQMDSALIQVFREYYVKPRRTESAMILRRGIDRDELGKELDVESSIDLIYGPLFYRLLVSGEPLTEDKVKRMIYTVFHGLISTGKTEINILDL
ncbi:TetR/AcrR family transcriptional regulator [Paenibacillus sp. MAH-36]|uniref:TetR/AcrR family transcriptional regulator n=1 Tax=Paenibacillus violae TaxID=3077234 RepID=A0ABU3RMM9_9BACL|nr:TetR/AcrR family transcriptional regulator [Paenibacillus sp. PFR10]MDU0205564.1 TetR/AcrR family transcriptional regulator [Paenibacillus sp. PFR10]